jgi:hypothetical protein
MKTISLKFEQVKKSKNGNSLVTLKTRTEQFENSTKAEEIVLNQLTQIGNALRFAAQSGATSVKVGGVNFSLKGKFYLYVTIDGQDYSTDELSFNLCVDRTQMGFKNVESLFSNMYGIIRMTEGKSPFLTNEAKKVLTKGNVKLLN